MKFVLPKKNLINIYGENSWVIVTGPSSGQGKQYSLQLAQSGFNILLIGSNNSYETEKIINENYPLIKTKVIIKDFSKSYEDNFFDSIKEEISNKDIAGLVSNVGMRYASYPYHKTPDGISTSVIATKAITQCEMIKIAINSFLKRDSQLRSFIIVISALCIHENSIFCSSPNTVPYMSIYEATNAFSYFHANSIYEELKINPIYKNIDFINVTPASVITKNTKIFLKNTPFSVNDKTFCKSVIKLLGNYNGITCGCFLHLFAEFIPSLIPLFHFKQKTLLNVGTNISKFFNKNN